MPYFVGVSEILDFERDDEIRIVFVFKFLKFFFQVVKSLQLAPQA